MKTGRVLIIGTRPPPIGGVTIHVERLLWVLSKSSFSVRFLPINIKKVFFANFFRDLVWCDFIHLHTSNPYVRLIVSVFCRLLRIRLISTIHGSLGRFRGLRNWVDLKSVKWTEFPLVLNRQSFEIACRLNRNSRLISAFLPPTEENPLPIRIEEEILELKSRYMRVWSTNAYNLSFDVEGREIYGISDLIEVFRENSNLGLTISDPTRNYLKYLNSLQTEIPKNVLFITEEHSFYEVMKLTDGMIRNTTTDGDALSVKEALYLGKHALVTDVVSRPKGAVCYTTAQDLSLLLKLEELPPLGETGILSGEIELLELYGNCVKLL